MQRELAYLLDILQSARLIQTYIGNTGYDAFSADIQLQDSVIRRIEIIGEATRRISEAFRKQHPALIFPGSKW